MGKKKAGGAASVPWNEIDADPIKFLVAPESTDAFFAECWERAPRVFKATPGRAALARSLTTLPSLLAWLKGQEAEGNGSPLLFGRDINAARYRDGARETPNGLGEADSKALANLHDHEGCTLQVHQPQRWDDAAWRLLAALEARLGALVGANAYLTPPGTQGLAPHHDDVEIWVLQTAGSKLWRCYAPVAGHELPNACSGDLREASLGAPVLEAALEPGDVLYMPRGTVHQARVARGGPASAHVTLSTWQRASYGDLALHLLGSCLRAQGDDPDRCLPLSARRGLPPGLATAHSLQRVLSAPHREGPMPGVVAALAAVLRDTAAKLEAHPDMLTPAVHSFSADFWASRLPPHPEQLPDKGPAPELGDSIWCRAAPWCTLVPYERSDDGGGSGSGSGSGSEEQEDGEEKAEEEEEENKRSEGGRECGKAADRARGGLDDGEGAVQLVTCLHNLREAHMVNDGSSSGDDDDDRDDEGESSGEDDEEGGDARGSGSGSEEEGAAGGKAAAKKGSAGGHMGCGKDCGHEHHEHAAGGDSDGDSGLIRSLLHGDRRHHHHGHGNAPRPLPGMAVPVASLPLKHDADKLHLAFALWAEGFAASTRAGSEGSEPKNKKQKVQQQTEDGSGQSAKKARTA